MKIAIVTSGNLSEMKGIMNFVHEKAKHLQRVDDLICDVYIISSVESSLFLLLTKKIGIKNIFSRYSKREYINDYDGVRYNNLFYSYGIVSNIIDTKIKQIPLRKSTVAKFSKILKEYDIVASHTLLGHYLASELKRKYNIPYVATWHGSDINVDPNKNNVAKKYTSKVMKFADANIFVSKALLETSEKICDIPNKKVIYTGPSDYFDRALSDEILKYKNENLVTDKEIVIGFIGNLIPIKNVLIIPEILSKLNLKLQNSKKFVFWIAGNGILENQLRELLEQNNIPYKFFGKLLPRAIPLFMSCLDILLLPSINEGLPLVTLEAKKCGVHVVASNVGGIKECIGIKNCFDLEDNFVDKISNRMFQIIHSNETVSPLDSIFSWKEAIEKEINMYNNILSNYSYEK